jgi:murein DD-endopeptidase MepM/ murein hydrolase activator NlpD
MPPLNRSLSAVVLVALAAGSVPRAEPPVIHWRPDPPRQGSLILVFVQPRGGDSTVLVSGALAEESLHFEPDGGAFIALGAVPLGAGDTLVLDVTVNGTTYPTSLPVARRTTSREELRTAPRFTRPPDSALAARIERERGMMAAAAARAHATPRLWSEPFARPRTAQIRSGFGLEREFNDVVESRHLGVDFAGRRGAPVYAANRGVVVLVESLFYAGRTVYLDHGAGLLTAYMHLDRALVAPGDTVRRGQLIGRVGATGRVTGPHLHWVARYGAILVDPLDLVTLDLTPLAGGGGGQARR